METLEERERWDRFVRQTASGSMNQCLWWADPLESYGVTATALACWHDDVLVGGAMLRSIPVPLTNRTITECLQGPLFAHWRPEWADAVLGGIEDVARRTNSIAVALRGCPRDDVAEDIAAAMRRGRLRVTRSPGDREAIVPLAGRTVDDVVAHFHKGTRRAIRKGEQGPVEVRRVVDAEQLRRAHDAWLATAARKGFSSVRPWDTAEPMLRHCIDAGLGTVFASFLDERLVAAIFVTYIGATPSYIYGGYVDGAERHRANHVLHLEAIREALAGGHAAYNLGTLTRLPQAQIDGVDQFKLGFGAVPVTRPDTVIWERKPVAYGVMQRLRRQRVGPAIEGLVRRRLARRATGQLTRSAGSGPTTCAGAVRADDSRGRRAAAANLGGAELRPHRHRGPRGRRRVVVVPDTPRGEESARVEDLLS